MAHVVEALGGTESLDALFGVAGGTDASVNSGEDARRIILTNAIFKNLTLRDYDKELLVLTMAPHEAASYEWEQDVSVALTAGVSERMPDYFDTRRRRTHE